MKMKKLEDIAKKDIFSVPEGYFDKLPGLIQARVAERAREKAWPGYFRYTLRLALPMLLIGAGCYFFVSRHEVQSPEELIASIDSSYLVNYLEETEISTEDLITGAGLNQQEAEAIQVNTMDELTVDEDDMEFLSNEFEADNF